MIFCNINPNFGMPIFISSLGNSSFASIVGLVDIFTERKDFSWAQIYFFFKLLLLFIYKMPVEDPSGK